MREVLKRIARAIATVVVAPELASFWMRAKLLGRDRALEGSSQTLSLIPGIVGQYLRRAFLCRVLDECHPTATVEFGTIFSKAGARLGENAYIGPRCHIGLAHIERDVLVAAGVHIPSGGRTHGTTDPTRPIREQQGERRVVTIGQGAWIGSAAVVMADVGRGAVIGAGAVVTETVPDDVFAVGVPAKVVKWRGGDREQGTGNGAQQVLPPTIHCSLTANHSSSSRPHPSPGYPLAGAEAEGTLVG